MDYVQRLQIADLQLELDLWTSPETIGHDTGLGAGLSLAGGSGDFFILPQLFFLTSPKVKEIMIFVVVDLLFNVIPIVCGSSVFVFVVLFITLCLS